MPVGTKRHAPRRPHVGVPRPADLDRLPRIRDFRGLNPDSFDGRGNFSLGIREQIIFPEIDYDNDPAIRGLDVTIDHAKPRRRARCAPPALGLPFTRRSTGGTSSGQEVA
jgi:hypothetical protein